MTGNHIDDPKPENDRGEKNGSYSFGDISGNISPGKGVSSTDADSPASPVASETLDLLVDGELDEEDRRALLLQMDAADGWKKCAVAFLEAQLFRQSFCAHDQTTDDKTSSSEPGVPVDVPERKKIGNEKTGNNVQIVSASWERRCPAGDMRLSRRLGDWKTGVWKRVATVTSLCMMTLVLGGVTVHWWESQHFPSGRPLFSGQTHAIRMSPVIFDSVISPVTETAPINFVAITPKMEYVSLPSGNSSLFDEQVPCFSSRDVDSLQYLKRPPGISSAELREINRSGGDVAIKRSHFVVPVGPERHAIIPVDRVDVHYPTNKKLL
ncbi:MAG: hypothetical protein FWC50_07645 [Planctomycetaceae bacterium]|nr:hypothetical protein [Planctomycetaceae bacterium]